MSTAPKRVGMRGNVEALDALVQGLVELYAPVSVYLFGSHARGDSGPDSDIDLLLVVPDDAPPSHRNARLAYGLLWGTGVAADVVIWPEGRFERRKHVPASLPATVLREGRILYGPRS
jgi:predicted nucleotidyltransferase